MTEEQLHRSCVDLLQVYRARGSLAFCHVPNGEFRHAATAGRLSAMGVVAGVPDLMIWIRGGGHCQIELKAPLAKRRLSPAQIDWARAMLDMGVAVHVCRSVDDVEAVLRAVGVPPVGKIDARPPQSLAGERKDPEATHGNPPPNSSHHRARKSEIA